MKQRLGRRVVITGIVFVCGAVVLRLFAGQLDAYYLRLAVIAAIWSVVVIGLNLTFGFAGQLNLAHGTFFAIGAYVTVIGTNRWGWSGPLNLLAAVLVATVAALLLGAAAFRARGFYLALLTAGVALVAYDTFVDLDGLTGGLAGKAVPGKLNLGPWALRSSLDFFMLAGVLALLLTAVVSVLRYTGRIRVWEAIREDETLARSLGVRAYREKMLAFTIGAVIASIAGVVFAYYSIYVSPDEFDFFHASFQPVLMLIIGGTGTLAGPIIGATAITLLPELFRFLGTYRQLVYAGSLLVIVLVAPRGIAGLSRVARQLQRSFSPSRRPQAIPAVERPVVVKSATLDDRGPLGAPAEDVILSVRGLTVRFSGLTAVSGVDLDFQTGQTVGIIGPNGAGKTTFINALTGVVQPTVGTISWKGVERRHWDLVAAVRAGMARTFQNTRIFGEWTALDNVAVAVRGTGTATDPQSHLDQVGLRPVGDQPASALAYGESRKLAIAMALATQPTMLLLDEPGVGMTGEDLVDLGRIIKELAAQGTTIVLIDHNMRFVMDTVDRVVVFDGGEVIADGSPSHVQQDAAVIGAYLGGQTDVAG